MRNFDLNKCILQKIANTIMINYQYSESIGLLNGYMGIAIFMYYYSRYSAIDSYRKLADELLGIVYANLNNKLSYNFAEGLTGIGWGFKHLKRYGFIEIDDDFLEEVNINLASSNLDELLKEFRSNYPVFSEGIYYINEGVVENERILYNRLENLLIELRNEVFPMGYINSVLYTIINFRDVNMANSMLKLLTDVIFYALSESDKKSYEYFLFTVIIRKFDKTTYDVKSILNMLDVFSINKLDNRNLSVEWCRFVYMPFLNDYRLNMDASKMDYYISNCFSNFNEKGISLSGLAGLGLNLMM